MTKPYAGNAGALRARGRETSNTSRRSNILGGSTAYRGLRMLNIPAVDDVGGVAADIDMVKETTLNSKTGAIPPLFSAQQIMVRYLFLPVLRRHSGDE